MLAGIAAITLDGDGTARNEFAAEPSFGDAGMEDRLNETRAYPDVEGRPRRAPRASQPGAGG
jgi:hypothetical protein